MISLGDNTIWLGDIWTEGIEGMAALLGKLCLGGMVNGSLMPAV
jgi:hypothetical protein